MSDSRPDTADFAPEWLELREHADTAARSADLVDLLRPRLAGAAPLVIRDLGCGTGSMGRWLAGRLPGPQRWILHDRDPVLLGLAAAGLPRKAAGGTPVTVEAAYGDITRLAPADLAGTHLVTSSALLDLLTESEVARLAQACAGAGCAALLALSVTGQVRLTPDDPLDGVFGAAFNAHQRRGGLLGPDAVAAASGAFDRLGMAVHRRRSDWVLGPAEAVLIAEWLRGWTGAAVEQRPALAAEADRYLRCRLDACVTGRLRVEVGHEDLLALPAQPMER